MKKILLCALFLCSTTLLAHPDQLKISITNRGAGKCTLKQKTILDGYVSDQSMIPSVIGPNETATFFMRPGTAYPLGNIGMLTIIRSFSIDKLILLTYACGDNQEITLFTDQGSFNLLPRVGGKVLDAQLINAQVSTRTPPWWGKNGLNNFSEIHWTLTY